MVFEVIEFPSPRNVHWSAVQPAGFWMVFEETLEFLTSLPTGTRALKDRSGLLGWVEGIQLAGNPPSISIAWYSDTDAA